MLRRIWHLAIKEFIQLVRDRMMALFLVLLPVAQLVLLAQATGQGISDLRLAVLDRDNTAASRSLIQALDNTDELVLRYVPADESELAALIEEGRAAVGVTIPAGFADALDTPGSSGADAAGAATGDRPEGSTVQVIVDASNSVVGGTAQTTTESTIAEYVRRRAAARGFSGSPGVSLHPTVRYNPDLNARLFTIPAQLGFIVYQVTLAVASLAFARERELGTLEQLLVTPLRRLELISGKAVLAWLVGLVDFLLMYVIATRGFQIPMRGSFGLLLALSMLFVTVEIGYGVIISSFSKTQQQAVLYVFMLAMLDVALSGYLVPVKNMPGLFQVAAQGSPMQHYLVIIRSIMLKGAGLGALLPDVAALGGIGVVVAVVAMATATRSLD